MYFDAVVATQCYKSDKLDNEFSYIPIINTSLLLEKHASHVYTLTIFYDLQEEICDVCFNCRVLNANEDWGGGW